MRKFSLFKLTLSLLCGIVASFALPLNSKAQTVSPQNGAYLDELSVITITFSGDVTLDNIDGIMISAGTTVLPPYDKPGEYGFKVNTNGNVATITLDKPYENLYTYEAWGSIYVEEGTFSVGGKPCETISADWTFKPSTATIPENPIVTPRKGSSNMSLSEITISWEGCGVEIVGSEYELSEVKFGIQGSNYSNANIASIEAVGDAGELGHSKVVIKVQNSQNDNQPFTEAGTYVLNLDQGIIQINATDGSAIFPGDEFTFFISNYIVSPQNLTTISSFNGLTIAGKDVEITDFSLIELYKNYYDTFAPPADEELPMAVGAGVTATEFDGVPALNVSFEGITSLYNGHYTFIIPAGVVNVEGKPINNGEKLYVAFTVTGNLRPLPEITTYPAQGNIEELSSVKVMWGEKSAENAEIKYGEILKVADGVAWVEVNLVLPSGETKLVNAEVVDVLDEDSEVEMPEVLGSYLNINLDATYTEEGEYTVVIPANTLTVEIDNTNSIPVDQTSIHYVIGDEPSYITVNPRVSPANNYVGGPVGVIAVTWPGVNLVMDSEDKDLKTPVDPAYVEITVNGNPVAINPNVTGGGRIWVKAQYESDGNMTEWRVDDQMLIELPDIYFFWTGDVKVEIKEGAVTSVTGEINRPISLNYTFISLDNNASWIPAVPEEGKVVNFKQGECVIYAYWEGYDNPQINTEAAQAPFYQMESDGNNGSHVNASKYMSIEDGKVKFDFTTLEAGVYLLDIPDGVIILGEGVRNGEVTYNFVITDSSMVNEIITESQEFEVYNLQGIRVLKTTDKDEITNLAKGLYIINGKKVLVK